MFLPGSGELQNVTSVSGEACFHTPLGKFTQSPVKLSLGLLKTVNREAKATYVLLSAWSFQEPTSQFMAPSCTPCFPTALSFLVCGPQSHPSSRLRIWALGDPSPKALPFQPAATQLAPINFLPSPSTHIWPPAARPSPAGLWGLPKRLAVLSLSPPTSPGHPTESADLKRFPGLWSKDLKSDGRGCAKLSDP